MSRLASSVGSLALLACALVTHWVKAAQPDEAEERRQLAAERQQIDTRFEREQAECRRHFALNACLDDARARQHQALADLRARQQVLDERQRQQRASERRSAIERKQQARQALPPAGEGPPLEPPVASAASAASAAPAVSAASRPARRAPRATDRAEAQAKAAERAAAARKLQEGLQADQERIKRRQAQRAAQGKKADPLPPPASSPG